MSPHRLCSWDAQRDHPSRSHQVHSCGGGSTVRSSRSGHRPHSQAMSIEGPASAGPGRSSRPGPGRGEAEWPREQWHRPLGVLKGCRGGATLHRGCMMGLQEGQRRQQVDGQMGASCHPHRGRRQEQLRGKPGLSAESRPRREDGGEGDPRRGSPPHPRDHPPAAPPATTKGEAGAAQRQPPGFFCSQCPPSQSGPSLAGGWGVEGALTSPIRALLVTGQ